MKWSLALLIALAACPCLAWSQASAVSSVDCSDEKDDAVRLKCYDSQSAKRRAAVAAAKHSVTAAGAGAMPAPLTTTPAPAAPVANAATPAPLVAPAVGASSGYSDSPTDPNFGLQGEALRSAQERASPDKGHKKPVALVARVVSVTQRPGFNLSLVLDNGQVWEQAEQRSDILISPNDSVTIKPGLMGSFLLTNASRHQSIRFRRVR